VGGSGWVVVLVGGGSGGGSGGVSRGGNVGRGLNTTEFKI